MMLLPLIASLMLLMPGQTRDGGGEETRPFWTGHPTAESFAKSVDARLARARETRDRLVAVTGPRTIANTLVRYDGIQRDIDGASSEAAAGRASELGTDVSLDRRVYDAVAAMSLDGADQATRYYVKRTLLAFRLAGVDKDEATANGGITITTAYPDALPVFTYAKNADLRRRLRVEFDNRAFPANISVLDRLVARRGELAHLLGYSS